MSPRLEHGRRVGLTLLLALAAALAFERLRSPLPWMIGPLIATAACGMAGLRLAASVRLRNAGLWLIGVALGLYFTPSVVALLLPLAPALLAGIAWAFFIGYAFYRFLLRTNGGVGGIDRRARSSPRPSAARPRWRCWPNATAARSTVSRQRIRCACCWWWC